MILISGSESDHRLVFINYLFVVYVGLLDSYNFLILFTGLRSGNFGFEFVFFANPVLQISHHEVKPLCCKSDFVRLRESFPIWFLGLSESYPIYCSMKRLLKPS